MLVESASHTSTSHKALPIIYLSSKPVQSRKRAFFPFPIEPRPHFTLTCSPRLHPTLISGLLHLCSSPPLGFSNGSSVPSAACLTRDPPPSALPALSSTGNGNHTACPILVRPKTRSYARTPPSPSPHSLPAGPLRLGPSLHGFMGSTLLLLPNSLHNALARKPRFCAPPHLT